MNRPDKINPEKPLPKTPPLRGAVCVQYRKCGKAGCRCARGELHGPYFYRFFRQSGRLCKEYVKREDVAAVRAACEQHRAFQQKWRLQREQSHALFRRIRHLLRQMEGKA